MFKFETTSVLGQSDEKLMLSIANGQTDAFNELYKRYHKRLLYYFYRMLWNNQELAQDFLQEIFFKIIDKPHLFNTDRKFSTWIFSIAHNMCKNEYRSYEVRKIVVKSENPDVFCEEKAEIKDYEGVIGVVFQELEKLDETHRTAFLLKYREGFSIQEISETMELPEGTIKSRLFYTRKKLQEMLTEKFSETISNIF